MRSRTIFLVALIVLLAGNTGITCAQNPLRAISDSSSTSNQFGNQSILNRILESPVESSQNSELQRPNSPTRIEPAQDSFTQPAERFDGNVLPASYEPPVDNRTRYEQDQGLSATSAPNFIEREQASFIEREKANPSSSKQNLGQLISKIGMNLAFVLALAIGFVLLAKQWMKPKSTSSVDVTGSDSLRVKETLVLDAKTTLRLVQWRTNRILVACDANGIRSVNVLNPMFDQTLDELSKDLEEEELVEPKQETESRNGIDENMLRVLLQAAQSQSSNPMDTIRRRAA